MILIAVNYTKWLLTVLFVTLAILLLVIIYRKILARLGKNAPKKKDYAVLYQLENDPVTGEIEFYFTIEEAKHVLLSILDPQMKELLVIIEKDYPSGGHIVRFDSAQLANGTYFYCLRSENQKSMKKMRVQHDNLSA